MTEAIASNAWTGGDAFDDLSDDERQGTLTYAPARGRLRWSICLALVVSFSGFVVAIGALRPGPFDSRWLRISAGLVMFVVSTAVAVWLYRRLADIGRTAPLVLRQHDLTAGSPPRTIRFENISSMERVRPRTAYAVAVQTAYAGAFWMFRSSARAPAPIVQLAIDGKREPVLLDLEILEGKPERIATVLSYRLQQAKTGHRNTND